MTPKEKAKELTKKFSNYAHWDYGASNNDYNSKNCVLIYVEETIKEYSIAKDINMLYRSERVIYWEQVKREIESL